MHLTQPKCVVSPNGGFGDIKEDRIHIQLERKVYQNDDDLDATEVLCCNMPILKSDYGGTTLPDFLTTDHGVRLLQHIGVQDGVYESIIFSCNGQPVPYALSLNQLLLTEDIHTRRAGGGTILGVLDKNALRVEIVLVR
jgi:hypothetical protein